MPSETNSLGPGLVNVIPPVEFESAKVRSGVPEDAGWLLSCASDRLLAARGMKEVVAFKTGRRHLRARRRDVGGAVPSELILRGLIRSRVLLSYCIEGNNRVSALSSADAVEARDGQTRWYDVCL